MGEPLTIPAAWHINRMMQAIPHNPDVARGLLTEPERIYDRFGLSEAERQPFRANDVDAIRALGIHPHLLMAWTMLTNERVRNFLMIDATHKAGLPRYGATTERA